MAAAVSGHTSPVPLPEEDLSFATAVKVTLLFALLIAGVLTIARVGTLSQIQIEIGWAAATISLLLLPLLLFNNKVKQEARNETSSPPPSPTLRTESPSPLEDSNPIPTYSQLRGIQRDFEKKFPRNFPLTIRATLGSGKDAISKTHVAFNYGQRDEKLFAIHELWKPTYDRVSLEFSSIASEETFKWEWTSP